MPLVAGIDSSTQSCKIVIRDAHTGALVRSGRAAHPEGTTVDPEAWWQALLEAAADAGGLADVAAVAVGGQQHGMVVLDSTGAVIRPAMLWNDTSSAPDADDLIHELGDGDFARGARAWADAVGTVPVSSLTVTKLRWLARVEPENAARVAAVALPHDWLTWRLRGAPGLDALTTDRSDASGTGYWSGSQNAYRPDLLKLALGREVTVPTVLGPYESPGTTACEISTGAVLGPGAGDNAGAALALDLAEGDVSVSLGTSGVVGAVSATPTQDPQGLVTGFADATGRFLPLVVTLNASRILDAACSMLSVDYETLSELALSAPAGSEGVVLVPYFDGERTPNKPNSTAALHGLRMDNMKPSNIARAAIEGMLSGLADGLNEFGRQGVPIARVQLIGGGAQSPAVRQIAPVVFGMDVTVPEPGEYVADGAARQAAWTLSQAATPPEWDARTGSEVFRCDPSPSGRETTRVISEQYAAVRELTATRGGQ